MVRVGALALLAGLSVSVAAAAPQSSAGGDWVACAAASAAVQRRTQLPPRLLDAIGIVETGRVDPARHIVTPWPWSVDANGEGHIYETKAAAIMAVQQFQAAGIDSIDVGCMQINLLHHPDAFANLEDAFDPAINTAYAGRFLRELFVQTGDWPHAAAAYHSQTPSIAAPYANRVMAAWPDAQRYGGFTIPLVDAAPEVDPAHVLTPAFRKKLEADAAFHATRVAAMRGQAHPSVVTDLARQHGLAMMRRAAAPTATGWRDAKR
jgi:hypothetical protein